MKLYPPRLTTSAISLGGISYPLHLIIGRSTFERKSPSRIGLSRAWIGLSEVETSYAGDTVEVLSIAQSEMKYLSRVSTLLISPHFSSFLILLLKTLLFYCFCRFLLKFLKNILAIQSGFLYSDILFVLGKMLNQYRLLSNKVLVHIYLITFDYQFIFSLTVSFVLFIMFSFNVSYWLAMFVAVSYLQDFLSNLLFLTSLFHFI